METTTRATNAHTTRNSQQPRTMTMKDYVMKKVALWAIIACAAMTTMITGCADETTGPADDAENPLGNEATADVSDPVSEQEASEVRTNVRRNADDSIGVEPEQIEDIILVTFPDGEVLGIHLDYDRDELNYECVVRSGGKVYVVVIDPQSGEVKEQKEIDEYYYTTKVKAKGKVKVKVKEACDRARDLLDGDVVEANLEEVEGEPTYIIIILSPQNRYITIYIDVETGKEKKLKNEKRCRGGEEDDDDDAEDGDDDGDDATSGDCDRHKNKKGRGHYRHGNGKGYGHRFHCHCECECDGQVDPNDSTDVDDSLQVISQDTAKIIIAGMFSVDTSAVDSLELATQDSVGFYTAVVAQGDSNTYNVTIDAETGALVEVTQTGGDFANAEFTPPMADSTTTLVAVSVARTAAVAQLVGGVESWTLSYDPTLNKWIYSFRIKETATGTVKTVRVDAVTGVYIDTI